ncbi:MAG: hypothetical protein EBR20_01520 [Bacteroidetes bacterium]|nr:hypothetical protein [Bacteroidota bacterium]
MRISLLALVFFLAACSSDSDNGALVDPGPPDDGGGEQSEEIRFSTDVLPVFAASCGGSGCHIGASASGVNLASWSATMASQGVQYGGPTVIAGNSSASPLVNKLASSPRFGSRMPLGRAPLSAASIQTIADWIDAGALDN